MTKTIVPVALAAVGLAATFAQGEVLWKADFSRGGWTNNVSMDQPMTFVYTNDEVRIVGSGKKRDTAFVVTSEKMPCAARGKYAFEYAVGGNFETSGKNRYGWSGNGSPTWSSGVRWYDAKGEVCALHVLPIVFRANAPQKFRVVDVIPSEAVAFDVRFGADVPNVCEKRVLTFAGAKMETASAGEPVGFAYPNVEVPRIEILDNGPRADATKPVVVSVTSAYPVKWDEVTFNLDGKDVKADSVAETPNGRQYVFRNGGAPWSAGIHRLKVLAEDCEAFTNAANKVFFVGEDVKLPPVRLRDDGILLLDGKPFFPIGIYGVCKREFNAYDFDRAIGDLKAAGFNTVQSYTAAGDPAYLAALRKYGMKTFRNGSCIHPKHVDEIRHDPTVIAWYLDDDTSDHHPVSYLWDCADNVRATDTTRLTCQADILDPTSRPSRYTYYAPATDVFLPEIYPVWGNDPKRDKGCVAETIFYVKSELDDNARVGDGRPRAVWPIIQMFRGYSLWKRMPTAAEMTAMSFAAIIHGAQGITWYTYGGFVRPEKKKFDYGVTSSEETWAAMTNVSRRISALAPVLVERTGVQPPRPEIVSGPAKDAWLNDSVSQLLKEHDGRRYLLTVNSTDQAVTARFRVKARGEVAVMGERRSLGAASDGAFTDTFAPYAVRIYRFR